MSNKNGKTQIPREAIAGPAGENDNIKVNVWMGFVDLKDINKETTKTNSETKTIKSANRPVSSLEIEQGMRIKTENTVIKRSKSSEIEK